MTVGFFLNSGTVTLEVHINSSKDLQPTLGLVLPVYALKILFEAVLHLYFFVSWLHMLLLALF